MLSSEERQTLLEKVLWQTSLYDEGVDKDKAIWNSFKENMPTLIEILKRIYGQKMRISTLGDVYIFISKDGDLCFETAGVRRTLDVVEIDKAGFIVGPFVNSIDDFFINLSLNY